MSIQLLTAAVHTKILQIPRTPSCICTFPPELSRDTVYILPFCGIEKSLCDCQKINLITCIPRALLGCVSVVITGEVSFSVNIKRTLCPLLVRLSPFCEALTHYWIPINLEIPTRVVTENISTVFLRS